jgi:putative ABC transport system permease protein
MHGWLENYRYRINISWSVFALAGIGSLLLTVGMVSFQAIRSALANPVRSLRTE